MWGCIDMFSRGHLSIEVPSLYVRVYLLYLCGFEGLSCSLTVCEGVSVRHRLLLSGTPFPHCMWGCIGIINGNRRRICVPSLYVRVYLLAASRLSYAAGSLTVCEGVSRNKSGCRYIQQFPHCMWGCIIVEMLLIRFHTVPSLYVRVYQLCSCRVYQWPAFHHYTWWCIAVGKVLHYEKDVPSLYVRVYHKSSNKSTRSCSSLTIREGISVFLF